MASLHWIGARTRSPFLRGIAHIPYIMGDDDEYLDAPNLYLQARCSGRVILKRGRRFNPSPNTIKAIGYRLTNIATWMECEEAHPEEGIIRWSDLAAWHINDLYCEQMVEGLWAQEFWATANRESLNYGTTISGRRFEAIACCEWLGQQGLIEWPKTAPAFEYRQRSFQAARSSLFRLVPQELIEIPPELKYKRRIDPGNSSPLTPEEIQALLRHIKRPVGFFAFVFYLTTGFRLDELVKNTLVPGTLHERSGWEKRLAQPRFPKNRYLLKYDVKDDAMIGVLPDEKSAFSGKALLSYRVMGKGKKIRTAWLLSSLLRDIWRYFVLVRAKHPTATKHSSMFLNGWGKPLNARNVAYAIGLAKKAAEAELGHRVNVTPHVLRHTFACFFIEAVISARAKEDGADPAKLNQQQLENYGAESLTTLQELLGHALIKDTTRYLRQLSMSRVGLRYLEIFTAAMGEVLNDESSF
ncbi:recombinase XerD [Rhizobium beringeri]|uniref:recombinase XerD n=1 Tax=Rhizobium beringeri TaxID=3019934 RepID=UPI003CEFA2B7